MNQTERLLTTLTFIFIFQKVLGISNWPWLWVICPIWGYWMACSGIGMMRYVGHFRRKQQNRKEFQEQVQLDILGK